MWLFEPNIQKMRAKKDIRGLIRALTYNALYIVEDAERALIAIGTPAVELLIIVLKNIVHPAHYHAAKILGQIGDTRAVEPLCATLKDDNWAMRSVAAKALGQIGDIRAVEPLCTALFDREKRVGEEAAKALGKIGDIGALRPLLKVIHNRRLDDIVRFYARESIGKIGIAAEEYLLSVLQENNIYEDLRDEAAWALGVICSVNAVDPLITALKDSDLDVRKAAAISLGNIGDERALIPLIHLLNEKDFDTSFTAFEALIKLGSSAVESLIIALKDEIPQVRSYAVKALAKIFDMRAVHPLITELNDTDWQVRRYAAEGLYHLLEEKASSFMLEDLQLLTHLNYSDHPGYLDNYFVVTGLLSYDSYCKYITELAQQELHRRGLDA